MEEKTTPKNAIATEQTGSSAGSSASLRRKSLRVDLLEPSLSENNDDAERLARRLNLSDSTKTAEHAKTNNRKSLGISFVKHMSGHEMENRISECLKLHVENKINMKNAFGLQMIDLMSYMIKKDNTNMTNLQVASSSLDASTKIYSYRVDGIYTEILKIAGGLDKEEDRNANDEENELGNNDENCANNEQKNDKKKKKRKKQHIFGTVENLKGSVDIMKPALWMMKEEDSETITALYQVRQSNNANSRFNLQLYSNIIVDNIENDTKYNSIEVTIPKITDFSNKEICPPIADFEFQGWCSDDDAENKGTHIEQDKDNEFQFDLNASLTSENEADNDNVRYLDTQNMEEHIERCEDIQKPVERIVDLYKVVSNTAGNQTSEYSFLHKTANVHWAGPTHWKISNSMKSLGNSKIVGACQQRVGRKKKEVELKYDSDEEQTEAILAKFKISKALTVTKGDWYEEDITLPQDVHYKISNATILYNHKLIRTKISKEHQDLLNNTHRSNILCDYDYNNDNDTSNCCPNDAVEGCRENDENLSTNDVFESEKDQVESQMNFYGGNLVALPKLLNKIQISYSMRAKRVDMKQLKKCIWKSLNLDMDTESTNSKNSVNTETEEKEKEKENKYFSEIYKTLPNVLTKANLEAVSFPLSFVSLLHVAAERTLKIHSLSDISDLIIEAD